MTNETEDHSEPSRAEPEAQKQPAVSASSGGLLTRLRSWMPARPALRPGARHPTGQSIGQEDRAKRHPSRSEEENRRIGKRGEEVAYNAERQRLKRLGKNPDSVHWISKVDELSPYDLMSVDEDDQLIWIEVKATRGSDPAEPFYISHAELIEATYRRSRYYVYRVTDVDSACP